MKYILSRLECPLRRSAWYPGSGRGRGTLVVVFLHVHTLAWCPIPNRCRRRSQVYLFFLGSSEDANHSEDFREVWAMAYFYSECS